MKNGLYSIHVTLLDGRTGKGSGVILFRDGQILGGDAYLFYTGSYTVKGDTFKGEVLVQRHTSSPDANPLFGGPAPVGIGVTGTFTDTQGTMNGTALVGKASQIFGATLRKLADIELGSGNRRSGASRRCDAATFADHPSGQRPLRLRARDRRGRRSQSRASIGAFASACACAVRGRCN